MVRIMFLIIILIIQLYGLFSYLRSFIKPIPVSEAIKKAHGQEARALGAVLIIAMAILYSVTFVLIARVIADKELVIILLCLAAFEVVLIVPRLSKLGELYSGTVQEQIKNWLAYYKSHKRILGFIGNVLETVIIVVALYCLFKEGAF